MILASFGLYDIIGIVLACFMIGVAITEAKSKKAGDLFTNIVIAVIGAGVSIYTFYDNLKDTAYKFNEFVKLPTTWIYLVTLLASITFVVFFVINYKKHKDDEPDPEEEKLKLEEAPLSNDEIEEILEKENKEEKIFSDNKEENFSENKEEKISDNKEEKISENKPIDEEQNEIKPEKEGATQVPKEQRNPFSK